MLDVSKGTIAMWEIGKREPNYETLNCLSDIFDKRIDYILGFSNDASSPRRSEEDIDQLGRWEVEDQFRETIMSYLSLDEYGKAAVESLIKAEKLRCHEQQSILSTDNIVLSIRINKK
jgi:transcriptional regulator with XRE-family HTH domain